MDVILSRFTAAELRVTCLAAVEDELQHAETQLQPALDALRRSQSVVRASREMVRAPLVLVDESPQVATALEQLVAACNEMGTLICDLSRELSSVGTSDASPSATDDEDQQVTNNLSSLNKDKAEPKRSSGTEKVERKKAAKETGRAVAAVQNTSARSKAAVKATATVIDLSLSDEEEVVKEEGGKKPQSAINMSVKNETLDKSRKEAADVETQESLRQATADELESLVSPAPGSVGSPVPAEVMEPPPAEMEDEQKEVKARDERPRRKTKKRKRKAPRAVVAPVAKRVVPPVAKRVVPDVVVQLRKQAEMAPSGNVGVAVCTALNAAIALEKHQKTDTKGPFTKSFASATAAAARVLVGVHTSHPVQAERHLEDMRLLMSVAAMNFKCELSREEVYVAWQMLKEIQKLHDIYPAKTKGLHRSWLELRRYLVKEYEVPADVVGDLKTQLLRMLVELRGWKPHHELPVKPFDQKVSFINELLASRYEMWDPRTEPILGRLVGTMERICDITDSLIRSDVLEPGFEDEDRVKDDIERVTSYDEHVRHLVEPDSKKTAFDELIDRLRWIFNAVAMTKNQSLLPLNRLKRLNVCITTLVYLCDYGVALTLEGCLHLEKLLLVMRQVMYIRIDYAKCSKRATDALIELFPPKKRPRFGYPEGCSHSLWRALNMNGS
ncbi:hypothetical protein KRP22_013279 [Phytophthora ramorum]|uniref:uncharacterized protein n=1 Tax=Phytophthora ramorum TaxID=164328 RepID=UPI0030AC1F9A|nr:hypothetical protein KRP23_11696 [Phytophthora ramorum]KAH7499445.1 hypothetical protein KRP22_10933 [Phytophthora ramorum]